jgi:YVTN family beta-propeller protein
MRTATWGICFGAVVTAALCLAAIGEVRYKSPDDLALSADGKRLYVVCSGSDEVLAVDTATHTIAGRVPVGKMPRGITITRDARRFYVTNSWSDTVSEVDAEQMKVLRTLPAGFEPTGLALDETRHMLYVANRLSDDISLIDLAAENSDGGTPEHGNEIQRLAGSRGASYVAASPDGKRIYVTGIYPQPGKFRTSPKSEITEIDAEHRIVTERLNLNNAAGVFHMAFSRDGRIGLAAELRPKNLIPIAHVEHGWVFGNSLAVFGEAVGGGAVQMPLDQMDTFPSQPFGVAIAPDQQRAYISASGSNEVLILDLAKMVAAAQSPQAARMANDLSASALYVTAHVATGNNPRSIAISPDGKTLYVANRLDDTISVIDTVRAAVTGNIALGGPVELTAERRGERLFYSSNYAFGHQFGCATCHLDSTFDGLSWDLEPDGFGKDIVDNRMLEEIKETAPYKWNGGNPDLQTECGTRTERFFFRSQGFRGNDLEDLVKYIQSIPLRPNRYRLPDGAKTPAQELGQAIFNRTTKKDGTPIPDLAQCFVCHSGPYYQSADSVDVGTGKATDRSPAIDIPELTNVVNSAPYLHDGSAKTLEEIWTVFNPQDKHGVTSDLTKDDLNNLIEYLKTL